MHGVMKKTLFRKNFVIWRLPLSDMSFELAGSPCRDFPVGTIRQTAVYFQVCDGFPLKPTPSKRGVNFC